MATFSGVTSPRHLTARAGPGNGCLSEATTPSILARSRTSSLYRSLRGSTRVIPISLGSPPTL